MSWISVKDKLPPELQDVLFVYSIKNLHGQVIKKDIVCGHIAKNLWHICYLFNSLPLNNNVEVTHWMPLPEKPSD